MKPESETDALVGSTADERLLSEDLANLPRAVGRPEPIPPPSRARGRLVGVGATLTGVTLIGGFALILLGAVVAIGGVSVLAIVAVVIGVILAATHWGWVHVAEATADALEAHRNEGVAARRRQWLETIEPYTRYEVTTDVADDGSITINRVRFRPVPTAEQRFTFRPEVEHTEPHSGEEPGAAITERAELLRRQAAADTERERREFEMRSAAHQAALLAQGSEREQLEARRAESQALSERINSNLRDPPLAE